MDVSLDRHGGRTGFTETLVTNRPYALGFNWSVNGPISDSCILNVIVNDVAGNTASGQSEEFAIKVCICGDANTDNSINISDCVFLIQYVFAGGYPPSPLCNGDANGDRAVNVSDAVYMVQYIFAGGPPPHCP